MTLREYLSRQNPGIKYDKEAARPTSTSTTRTPVSEPIEGKRPWRDFDLVEINTVFGYILDQTFRLPAFPPPLYSPELVIENESSFESVLMKQNSLIVNVALEAGRRALGEQSGRDIPPVLMLGKGYRPKVLGNSTIFPD